MGRAEDLLTAGQLMGYFLGWTMEAGCKFRNKYRVVALCDFDEVTLKESSVHTDRRAYSTVTSRITWPRDAKAPDLVWDFPLAQK